jgi:hypothetical protein
MIRMKTPPALLGQMERKPGFSFSPPTDSSSLFLFLKRRDQRKGQSVPRRTAAEGGVRRREGEKEKGQTWPRDPPASIMFNLNRLDI